MVLLHHISNHISQPTVYRFEAERANTCQVCGPACGSACGFAWLRLRGTQQFRAAVRALRVIGLRLVRNRPKTPGTPGHHVSVTSGTRLRRQGGDTRICFLTRFVKIEYTTTRRVRTEGEGGHWSSLPGFSFPRVTAKERLLPTVERELHYVYISVHCQ